MLLVILPGGRICFWGFQEDNWSIVNGAFGPGMGTAVDIYTYAVWPMWP